MGGLTKNGILLYKFPPDYQTYVESVFDENSISRMECGEIGLKIYFIHYDYTRKYILMRNVTVKGKLYEIYPIFTNLTVQGVKPYLTEPDVKSYMEEVYGHVVAVYSVTEQNSYGDYEITTDDYRVILDIPEVLANFPLTTLSPYGTTYAFTVTFFCRLCRQNNHKQHQCNCKWNEQSMNRSDLSPFSPYESFDTFRYSNSTIQMTLIPSEDPETKPPVFANNHNTECIVEPTQCYWKKTKLNTFNETASHDLGNDYGSDSSGDFSQNHTEVSSSGNRVFHRGITHSGTATNSFSSMSSLESSFKAAIPRSKPTYKALSSKTYNSVKEDAEGNRASSVEGDRNVRRKYTGCITTRSREDLDIGYAVQTDDESTSKIKGVFQNESEVVTSNECRSDVPRKASFEKSNKKRRSRIQLGRILPPSLNKNIIDDIKAALTTGNRDIPEDVELKFRNILQWNRRMNQHNLTQREKNFVKWIRLFLAKSRRNEPHEDGPRKAAAKKKDLSGETSTEFPKNKTGVFSQSLESEEKKCCFKKREYTLSPGIRSVIHKVRGKKLAPDLLINFLEQVRGRKKVTEIAGYFVKDTASLINQLESVCAAYYRFGYKGKDEDNDIKRIKGLCKKLEGNRDASKTK